MLFGACALRRILPDPPQPAAETARAVVAGLIEHVVGKSLTSDATDVRVDWTGRAADTMRRTPEPP